MYTISCIQLRLSVIDIHDNSWMYDVTSVNQSSKQAVIVQLAVFSSTVMEGNYDFINITN